MRKLTDAEKAQITGAIRELDALGVGGAALADSWTRIQRAGLMLRDSLNGRPPSHGEAMLIAAAERCERFNPLRPPLEDLANDSKTREQVITWKRRAAEARQKADAAKAALDARRAEIVETLRQRGAEEAVVLRYPPPAFVLIDEVTGEREGLRPLEREALLARVAATEVERAFAVWRLRAWSDGKLKSTKGQ